MQQQLRDQQVASLRQRVPRIMQMSPNGNQWSVNLTDPRGQLITQLMISLSLQFPSAPPDIRVTPLVGHPWIDREGAIMGHPHLGRKWHPSLDLGRIVSEILQEFTMRPPQRFMQQQMGGPQQMQPQQMQPGPQQMGQPMSQQMQQMGGPQQMQPMPQQMQQMGGPQQMQQMPQQMQQMGKPQQMHPQQMQQQVQPGQQFLHQPPPQQQQQQQQQPPAPPRDPVAALVPDSFPEIEALSAEHLEYLSGADRESFLEILHDFEVVQAKKSVLVELMESNAIASKTNLQIEPRTKEMALRLEKNFQAITEARDSVNFLVMRRGEVAKSLEVKELHRQMLQKHHEAQSAAEKIAEDQKSDRNYDKRAYIEARQVQHRLAAKADKLRELLD
ncbi:unnamed protein product [Amoebophrya sp. A25]|nr:unnamed protein product [Amoebophrya sp. A25]|eukprot:GSA25T00005411001.1